MKPKSAQIREKLAMGDHNAALRIASHFFDRSRDTKVFKRGWGAHNHPDFYRQLGQDPQQITAEAIALLKKNFLHEFHHPTRKTSWDRN